MDFFACTTAPDQMISKIRDGYAISLTKRRERLHHDDAWWTGQQPGAIRLVELRRDGVQGETQAELREAEVKAGRSRMSKTGAFRPERRAKPGKADSEGRTIGRFRCPHGGGEQSPLITGRCSSDVNSCRMAMKGRGRALPPATFDTLDIIEGIFRPFTRCRGETSLQQRSQ